jgi:hypothetical protein
MSPVTYVNLAVRVSPELHADLARLAQASGRSLNAMVSVLLKDAVERSREWRDRGSTSNTRDRSTMR